jgi:hypothetical protein
VKLSARDVLDERGDPHSFRCRATRCRRRVVASGHNGFRFPFCLAHLERLTPALLERLQDLAETSPFDRDSVAKAEAAVERALRHMSKPPKGSRRC